MRPERSARCEGPLTGVTQNQCDARRVIERFAVEAHGIAHDAVERLDHVFVTRLQEGYAESELISVGGFVGQLILPAVDHRWRYRRLYDVHRRSAERDYAADLMSRIIVVEEIGVDFEVPGRAPFVSDFEGGQF